MGFLVLDNWMAGPDQTDVVNESMVVAALARFFSHVHYVRYFTNPFPTS